jgi:hypothetical protein
MIVKPPRKSPDTTAARNIVAALVRFHEQRDEICLPETEVGRTGLRADLFTIKPSWKPVPTIYEVKTSRSDFLRDDKWTAYLPYCERFYFAFPPGLVKPEEVLDKTVGIVNVTADGTVLIIRTCRKRKVHAKNIHLMLHRLLFRYVFANGGRTPVQPSAWSRRALEKM